MFFSLTFLFQVNLEYLESKLESVDGEEVQRIQDNINSLFHHCVQALGEEHQIKVVNALQVNNNRGWLQSPLLKNNRSARPS